MGPSLCGSILRNGKETVDLMLKGDSLRLIKTEYYKNPRSEYNLGVHLLMQFDFKEIEREQLLSFIDTITVMQ